MVVTVIETTLGDGGNRYAGGGRAGGEGVMTTILVGMAVMIVVHSGSDGSGDDHNISGDRTGLGMVW